MKRRVFIDTGVFIAAWQGRTSLASRALALIENPEVERCTSSLTKLESLNCKIRGQQVEFHSALKMVQGFYAARRGEGSWEGRLVSGRVNGLLV